MIEDTFLSWSIFCFLFDSNNFFWKVSLLWKNLICPVITDTYKMITYFQILKNPGSSESLLHKKNSWSVLKTFSYSFSRNFSDILHTQNNTNWNLFAWMFCSLKLNPKDLRKTEQKVPVWWLQAISRSFYCFIPHYKNFTRMFSLQICFLEKVFSSPSFNEDSHFFCFFVIRLKLLKL